MAIITTKTFAAYDSEGDLILRSRGKAGAAQKVLDALYEYRDAVKTASGYLYGNPYSLGRFEIDGKPADIMGYCGEAAA